MKSKVLPIGIICLFVSFGIFAQTGPAGIGNTDGSNWHPRNVVWLDASDLTVFGAGDTWADKSGNGHHAISAGADISLGDINGAKALDFSSFSSGNFSIAHHADFDDISELSFFVVYNSGTSTNPQGLVSKRAGTGDISFSLFQHTDYSLYADYIESGNRINGANNASETNYIANYIFQTDDSLKIYKNGVLDNGAWELTGASNTNNTSVNIEIGKLDEGYSDNNNFKGKIAEIIVYKNNLSPAQRALVTSYLSSKYAIEINEINLAYSPSSGDFYNDLTGYGRSSTGFKDFGASAGVYLSLNDAVVDDYISGGHNGAVNQKETIQTGSDVVAFGAVAAWNRAWYIEKGGNSDAVISFSLPEGIENGSFPQELDNYVLLRKNTPTGDYSQVTVTGKSIEEGDRVKFEIADVDFQNGYYTLGTLDQSASPLEGGSSRTWYTLISGGDWDDPEVWTLDPSGALPKNPNNYTPSTSPTSASDRVVVLNGKRVAISVDNKQTTRLTVDGTLDLQNTQGHNFVEIRGKGRILLSSDNFPAGDATHFVSRGQGEGTVVYYGNSYNLSQELSFFDLEIDLSGASEKVTLLNNFTVNGNLRVKTGALQFNDASQPNDLNVTVHGNVMVEENGEMLTGTANARHQFNMYGDFTNNGTVEFTNRTSATYNNESTDGIVDINFLNDNKNQLAFFNGPSKVYRIEIDKGTDDTYELILEATNTDYFDLLGYANDGHGEIAQLTSNSNALGLLRGTVRIKSNIVVPQLNNSGNYNISEAARLWVDGGYVAKTSGTAIVPYGVIQISEGTLESLVSSGITTRGNALIRVEGGALNINQLRTSIFGEDNVGGYVQSGGVTNVLDGGSSTDYYRFNLTYPGNVFSMSGGTLHIHDANSRGGIFIASEAVNQNVTGGTVIADINGSDDFPITSTAPFWNFIVRNSASGTSKHVLSGGTNSISGGTDASLDAQPLRVLNDLTIETGSWLDANGEDVFIGRNFTIEDNALYEFHNNTTVFNGTEDGKLYVGDITALSNPSYVDPEGVDPYASWEQPFHNFTIEKPDNVGLTLETGCTYDAGNTSVAKNGSGCKNIYDWSSNLVKITGAFNLESGYFDIDKYSVRLYDEITNKGIFGLSGTPKNALIKLRKDSNPSTRVVTTAEGAQFGNLRLNSGAGIIEFTSDVYVKRMEYKHGRINIGKHNLKIDTLVFSLPDHEVVDKNFSVQDMIIMDGNASDGGLSLYVPQVNNPGLADSEAGEPSFNSNVYFFPVGTGTIGVYPESRYTPANIRLQSVSDDGYITLNIVSEQLQTVGPHPLGDDMLSKYFRIRTEGFSSPPKVERYLFHVTEADIPDGTNDEEMVDDGTQIWNPGYVLDSSPYTRTYEINDGANASSGFRDNGAQDIQLFFWGNEGLGNPSGGFDLVEANYTAGSNSKFTGEPTVFYNRRGGPWDGRSWGNTNSWYDTPDGNNHPSAVPGRGDIVIIRGNYIENNDAITVNGTREVAEIIFQREGVYSDIESLPRLRLEATDKLTAGKISGVGDLYLQRNTSSSSVVNADIGEFAANDTSLVQFYMTQNGTYDVSEGDFFDVLPTLRIYGQNSGYDREARFNYNMEMKNLVVDGEARLLVGGDYTVENRTRLGFTGHGGIEFPNGLDAYTFSTGEFVTGKAKNQGGNDYKFTVATGGGNGIDHLFEVREDILLNFSNYGGVLDMDLFTTDNDNNVVLKLTGEGDHFFVNDYSDTNSTIELYKIEVDKGNDAGSSFTFNDNFSLKGATDGLTDEKAIKLLNGELVLNNNAINLDLTTGGEDFLIPGTAALKVIQGLVSANSGIILDGKLEVSGGAVDMSGGDNYIRYSASGNAAINVSAGELIVGSQIRRGLTSSEGILNYTQSGGTVIVGNDVAPVNNRGVIEVLNDGSNFTFTGGELQVVRAQSNPSFASVYLNPETSTLNAASLLKIGNADTPAYQEIGIYLNVEIPNLLVSNESGNNPLLRQWTVPLTIGNSLEIQAGAVFDANGKDLILKGDLVSNGQFISNENSTFFSGTTDQEITGSVDFYNLTKASSTVLNLTNSISVNNVLTHQDGVLSDNGNIVSVGGDMHFHGDHQWGGSGRGIVLNGVQQQTLSGSGSYGKLTINNPQGVFVVDENNIYIDAALQMEQGVFNVGANLLTIGGNAIIIEENPFSETNMIQTNISFTDNGVRKHFSGGAVNFTYPVGSTGRYTPVSFIITENSSTAGSLLVKPAAEFHPSVDDKDNVLQYHWLLRGENLSGFTASARMKYDIADVKGDIDQYITARLLSDGSGEWNKFSEEDVDKAARELEFSFTGTDDAGISGDYTAGLDIAIPDQVPTYITTQSGNYNDSGIWDTYPVAGETVPAGGPRGAMVIIAHEVDVPLNYTSSYRTTISETGILSMGSSYGHRLGEVDGEGTLKLESGNIPAGVYDDFVLTGTFEFTGNDSYNILSGFGEVNNLVFTGTGARRLPGIDIQVYGDIVLNGPSLINESNRSMFLFGDFLFDNGAYDAGSGSDARLVLIGNAQQVIRGIESFSGSNKFNHFEINNNAGVLIYRDVEVESSLTLNNGVVNNSAGSRFALLSYNDGSVTGGSASSYVSGPFEKAINSGSSFTFPIGDNGRFGEVEVSETGATGAGMWEARYYSYNPGNDGFDPASMVGDLKFVSNNEYWRIKAPASTQAHVRVRWDSQSGISANESEREGLRIVSWESLSPDDAWVDAGDDIVDVDGTIKTTTSRSFNNFAQGNYYTIGGVQIYTYPWIGINSNWFDTQNWNTGNLPSVSTEVSIPASPSGGSFPSVDGDAYCKDLEIESSATVTLEPGATLNISNLLNNNGEIVLKSDPDNVSALNVPIDNTSSGQGRIELPVKANQWYRLGQPIVSPTGAIYDAAELTSWIYKSKRSYERIVDDVTSIDPMEGIMVLYEADHIIDYSGELNTGPMHWTIPYGKGYYLFSNPYPSSIKWDIKDVEDTGVSISDNLSATIYYRVYAGTQVGDYMITFNGSTGVSTIVEGETFPGGYTAQNIGNISPLQSVWVRVADDQDATIDLTNKARIADNSMPLKSGTADSGKERDLLRIVRTNDLISDVAIVYFDESFSDGADRADSEKMFNSSEGVSEIYTRSGNIPLSINGLSSLSGEDFSMPLSVRNRSVVATTIRVDMEEFTESYDVFLEDRETGVLTDMHEVGNYSYNPLDQKDVHDRFVLHLKKVQEVPTDLNDLDATEVGGIEITGHDNFALVKVSPELVYSSSALIEVMDMNGRRLSTLSSSETETMVILPGNSGAYIIRVNAGGQVKVEKVVRGN